jgi:methionyl-tRNA formyltransferase
MTAPREPLIYPYAQGDLLETRNTYFYTPFHGRPFLKAWEAERSGILSAPSAPETGRPPEFPQHPRPTDLLLDSLHEAISRRPDAESWSSLDRLLQRFEVTKRLHGEYNSAWRPCDPADYTAPQRYLRFAEVLEIAYAATAALPYLNGLLKCMDTLTALHAQLQPAAKERLHVVVMREREHVQALRRRLLGGADGA